VAPIYQKNMGLYPPIHEVYYGQMIAEAPYSTEEQRIIPSLYGFVSYQIILFFTETGKVSDEFLEASEAKYLRSLNEIGCEKSDFDRFATQVLFRNMDIQSIPPEERFKKYVDVKKRLTNIADPSVSE